ncbi:MAG: S8 family serine peptidase, partial [Geitlerinemataceae cyanobacterium]
TEEDAIADDVEATNNDSSNTSQSEESEDKTEEDAIADDVDVAVDPIPEIDPVPLPELASGTSGIYTVGSDATVLIDYNYDHGKFESEVAIVSTSGLEDFLPIDGDFSQFNAEVSRRALSGSELGHIVIADATEGARFSNSKWGPDRNLGTYLGVKSFQMNPGDNFMVVMVPNRTFQETLDKSGTNRSQQLLFSVAELNPGGHVQFVQVAEGGADGNLFAFEDLRLDRNSDKSFNDIVLQMRGIEGQTPLLSDAVDLTQGFWSKDIGQALIDYGDPYLSPAPIELPISLDEPLDDTEIEDLPSDGAGLNTTITRDDDTAEAGLETTIVREDEVVAEENTETEEEETVVDASTETEEEETVVEAPTETEEEETVVDAPTDTASEDTEVSDDSTGVIDNPVIEPPASNPPERFEFPKAKQPLVGIIDTGLTANNPDIEYGNITLGTDRVDGDADPLLQPGEGSQHGTHVAGIIAAKAGNGFGIDGINPNAPLWVGRAIDSGEWSESFVEFVHATIASEQPNGVAYLGFDLTQINPDGTESTRFELTPEERGALEFARQNGILIVVPAGNQGGVMSVLGQASREFDNIIAVGAAENFDPTTSEWKGFDRVNYSSHGRGLDIVAPGGTVSGGILSTVGNGIGTMAGTSVAAAQVAGAVSLIQAANPDLNYRQVKDILKLTATDLNLTGTDGDTGAGLLNIPAAVKLAKVTEAEDYDPQDFLIPDTWSGEGLVTPDERPSEFHAESFSLRVWPEIGVNLRNSPNYDDRGPYNIPAGTYLEFDGWDYGTVSIDPVSNEPDALFYRTQYNGQTFWVPSIWIAGYPSSNPPLLPPDDGGGDPNLPYAVSGEFWNIYNILGGAGGIFGNPISDRYAVNGGERQDFQGGTIIESSHGTFPLFGGIGAHYLFSEGGEAGRLGFPTSGEIGVGNGVIVQKFENGQIVYGDGDTRTEMFDNTDPTQTIINGYTIDGSFYPVFQQYQGTLGNPVEGVQTHPSGATFQRFDNGSIVSSEHGTFPLYGGIRQEYLNNSGLDGWLGSPTSPEVQQGNGFIKQTFENGYIIWNGSHAVAYESPNAPVQPPSISNPTPISNTSLLGKKISLDPGHGITNLRFDPGASGNGTTEAIENLVQANIIAEYLRQRGAEVTIVDEYLSLTQIGQRGEGSDAFVSLHLNASELKNAQGHEVLADPTAPQADFDLANAINSELDLTFPDTEIPNRGVKTQILAVLRGVPTSVPAALTEALFIDAPGMSRANVEKAAQAIARGIEKFFTGSTTDTGNTDGGNSSLDQPLLSQQGVSYFTDRPQFYTTGNIFTQAAFGSNLVDGYSRTEGNCTWYAHGRVKELGGNPAALNSMSGHAYEWHTQISNGTQIVSSPQPGDIAQWTSNGQNHVAVVETVHPNGTMTISESHYNTNWDGGGAGTLHSIRTINISEPDRYIRVPGV